MLGVVVLGGGGDDGGGPSPDSGPFETGTFPVGVSVAPSDGRVLVADQEDHSVTAISSSGEKLTRVLGGDGIAVALDSVWVVSTNHDSLTRIDLESPEKAVEINVGDDPRDVVFAFGWLWVTDQEPNRVWRIDPATNEVAGEPIDVGTSPEGIAAGEDALYVAGRESGTVVALEPPTQ